MLLCAQCVFIHFGVVWTLIPDFLIRGGDGVLACGLSLWLNIIDRALLIYHHRTSVDVFDVLEMSMLFRVLVVGVVFEALESLKLVPDCSVFNRLDLGGLSDSWLIGDGELLLLKLNVFNWLMFIRVLLLNVASIVRSIPGLDSSEQEGGGKSSHSVYL